jgi:hypothetical protein
LCVVDVFDILRFEGSSIDPFPIHH